MDVFDAIEKRRAVKHFDPEFKMPEDDFEKLIWAGMQAPTSFNIQNWRFVSVVDSEKRKAIRQAAWDQAQVTDASLLFVMCADVLSWDKSPERYWSNAPTDVQEILVPMIKPFYQDREWLQRDEAMRSVGFAAQNIMLSAKALGYDSCPMIGFDQDQVAQIINLPDDHVIVMLLVVGKATKEAWPKPGQLGKDDILITDQF